MSTNNFEPMSGGSRFVLTLAFACLCCVYCVWCWSNDISDFEGDSSVYMMAGRFYSPFWAHSAVYQQFTQGMTYPPLFPLLIGLLGGSFLAAHLLVAGCLLTSIAVLFAWMRLENLGANPTACICLVFALMPGTYLQTLNIWSENPYVLFSLLAILFVAHAERSDGLQAQRLWYGAAIAIACAMMIRTAALPLVGALILVLLIRRPQGWAWTIALACSPPLMWSAWTRLRAPAHDSYAAQWTASYAGDFFGALLGQMKIEFEIISASWRTDWLGEGGGSLLIVCLLAAAMSLIGAVNRLRQYRFDGLYVTLYTMELLAWPFPGEGKRLSYVLIPVVLAQGVLWIYSIARRSDFSRASWVPALALGAMLIVTLPTLFLTGRRFIEFPASEPPAARHIAKAYLDDRRLAEMEVHSFSANLELLKSIGELVPADGCVFSIKPSIVALYSDRASVAPPASKVSDQAFDQGIRQCCFAYLMNAASPTYSEAFYPATRLAGRLHPLSIAGSGPPDGEDTYAILAEIGP